jgi:hypothetical protein
MSDARVVLLIGSAPDALRSADWPRSVATTIVAINNAWRIRPDWDYLVAPDDFPADRHPPAPAPGQRVIGSDDYVPANNRFGGVFYCGGTMAFSAGYWALDALRPTVLAYVGCDMIYAPGGQTHFYGTGTADPLRDDPSLRSLEAKSARLMLLAARQGCACVRLSSGDSRLVFPAADHRALAAVPPPAGGAGDLVEAALAEERRLGYVCPSGRYWEVASGFLVAAVDALDAMWLKAARPGT